MSEVNLFPHNEEAYKKLIECLKTNKMVAINHATGTGKSFIILKYLNENKDKRILYFAPTYPIINQFLEEHTKDLGINIETFNKLDSIIYSNLMKQNIEQIANDYDIFILDEYHRCGAPKWGEKVNELLEILRKQYPEKIVIGTTATEIRFLDNEKDMNNILFNGVCASNLSLSDAILRGILPVPIYINAVYELYEVLDQIEQRVLKKCYYKKVIDLYLEKILELRLKLDKALSCVKNSEQEFSKGGKFLVFSSEIKKIPRHIELINNIFNKNINSHFEVHSGKSKTMNKEIIKKFIELKEGSNFLYSVNILNEGLHVKDIDAIFMFRRTTSPIIYFQQLGRLLSCSKKKEKVFVFDFVNNIRNHPYIYMLYQEVYKRANELMLSEPENKEFYQNILDRFKIINLSSDISEKIDELSNETKLNKLKKARLSCAVLILEGKVESTFSEKIQAQIDIFKFKNFIDIELFNRIKELDIKKPKIFKLTSDNYILYLNDPKYKKKYDKENTENNLMCVNNDIIFTRKFEIVLKKIDLEMNNFSSKEEYIKDLYDKLIKFIKENKKNPKYNKGFNNIIDIETELFIKKIIFYNDLEKNGYIQELNNIEISFLKGPILQDFFNFVFSHDSELPSLQSSDKQEVELVNKMKKIESYLNETEIILIKNAQKKQLLRIKKLISLYIDFIKKHKRYPLKDSTNEEERLLFESYLRCEEYFSKEEKQIIKDVFNDINKKQLLKNSYLEILKKRK